MTRYKFTYLSKTVRKKIITTRQFVVAAANEIAATKRVAKAYGQARLL